MQLEIIFSRLFRSASVKSVVLLIFCPVTVIFWKAILPSKADSVDAAINMILIEEMPAYFAGQKTLEQVIPVMQNRIQKVLDERK